MKTFTITHFLVYSLLIAVIVPAIYTMPTTSIPVEQSHDETPNDEDLLVVPNEEEMELVPVAKGYGEDMETANARYYPEYYYYRPVYTYRRTNTHRRRVYAPRRSSYDDGDRFPTVT